MADPDGPLEDLSSATPWGVTVRRVALRLAVIIGVAVLASWLISYGMTLTQRLPAASQDAAQVAMIGLALVIYALLIATPFVPGLEIGIALLMVQGASIAPLVYLATALGLVLAFAIGRMVPVATLERSFRDLRLRRAADQMARYALMSLPERQQAVQASLPRWLAGSALRYRYLTLALLINLPGNAIFGGGGGLLLAAGFSRLFEPLKTVPTVFVAVLPLPIGFTLFGPMIFG